jgi:phage shock protein E
MTTRRAEKPNLQAKHPPMKIRVPIFLCLLTSTALADSSRLENPLIDFAGHRCSVAAVEKLREHRRITEKDFLRMAGEPGTIVLDARSSDMFQRLHIAGAINLSFPDFTAETLARAIPAKTTRVLIYCNNNFTGSPLAFPSKQISVALNLSTFVALHAYGYVNVYELGPLLDVETTVLPLVGTDAPSKTTRPAPRKI